VSGGELWRVVTVKVVAAVSDSGGGRSGVSICTSTRKRILRQLLRHTQTQTQHSIGSAKGDSSQRRTVRGNAHQASVLDGPLALPIDEDNLDGEE
jgi:hypothetical protein